MARRDPLVSYKFRVEVAGVPVAGFSSVSGLQEESDVVTYRSGDDPITERKLPGITSYGDVTLTRGVGLGQFLVEWRRKVSGMVGDNRGVNGSSNGITDSFRLDVRIVVFDTHNQQSAIYKLYNAWPSALELSDIDSTSSDPLIETLTLVHEGITYTVPGGTY